MADKQKPEKAAQGGAKKAAAPKGADKQAAGEKAAAKAAPRPADYRPRMKTHYENVVRSALAETFSYKNPMQVPKLDTIVLYTRFREAVAARKYVDSDAGDLARMPGQSPVPTQAP